ncbi:MAG: helix-turn-helix domain-containing protein, partial [Deltaproteobacteria bacterium]|nr:helix-turn-helix domain-containing protein [Deltaproteobacteria bacterium]
DPLAWVRLPATREQLGEVLGLTLETVSRAVQRLVARGHLELRGRDLRLTSTHDENPLHPTSRNDAPDPDKSAAT